MSGLLKDGYKHMEGLEGAILKNVEACKKLSGITRTSLGPNGMNKLVINHLEKIFVTSDAATIVQELEVQHPAAKMLVMAAQMQEQEVRHSDASTAHDNKSMQPFEPIHSLRIVHAGGRRC